MKQKVNIRNLIIVMLSITIIFMGIGFAFISTKLETANNKEESFDISITKVEPLTAVKGGLLDPTATKELINDGKTIDFKFILNSPKDELAYNITIKNNGTLPAKIIKIIDSPDYLNNQTAASSISPVVITHDEVTNKTLEPDEELTLKLAVLYNVGNSSNQMYIPYQLTVLATSTN